MSTKPMFKALFSTDHHNLHPHTPTRHILANMDRFYYRDTVPKEISLSVFGGDFFHGLAPANDPDMIACQRWAKRYNHVAHNNKTHVRYLEGTSSHDRRQPELLEITKPKDSQYIKYIDKLSIEHFPEFDIHVMYVPDNFGKVSTDLIYDMAIEEMARLGIECVDFIFLHGGFKFQLPPIADKHGSLYDEEKWSLLAKHAIFSGHIHKPGRYKNIYGAGSFDRTAYGEMHAKGAYQFEFNKEKFVATFYENVNAQIYDYMDITPETTSKELMKRLNSYLSKTPPPNTHLKVRNGNPDMVVPLLTQYKEQYPQYYFESDNAKKDNVEIDESLYNPQMFEGTSLTPGNLVENTIRFMQPMLEQAQKDNVQFDVDFLETILKEAMDECT